MDARPLSLPHVSLRVPALGPHGRRRLAVGALLAGLLVATFLIVRESSLVAVRDVSVTGVSGRDSARVRAALTSAAQDMTTLHVDVDALRTAVAPYPIVKDLRVHRDLPHGLRISVIEHVPVAGVSVDGQRMAVAADGTLLRGTSVADLPTLPLRTPPAGDRIPAGQTARIVAVLGAAPVRLRPLVSKVFVGSRGLTLRLSTGTSLYFGTTDRVDAKWAAAARVLADPSSKGATYLDVRLPERPAAGGLEQVAVQQQQTASSGGTAPGESGTPGAVGGPAAGAANPSATPQVTP